MFGNLQNIFRGERKLSAFPSSIIFSPYIVQDIILSFEIKNKFNFVLLCKTNNYFLYKLLFFKQYLLKIIHLNS